MLGERKCQTHEGRCFISSFWSRRIASPPPYSWGVDLSHMQPQAAVKIQSYGEPSTALTELLVPFLAKRHFAVDRRGSTPVDGDVFTALANLTPNDPAYSDAVIATGQFNCITVTYYTWMFRHRPNDPKGPGRASAFLVELKSFLDSLPTPRTAVSDVTVGSKHPCGNEL
jgi:hypothetical protein